MARLFISQSRLDELVGDDRAVLDGERCKLPALGASFRLQPAVHFKAIIDGADPHDLVGRVKTEAALRAVGGDLLHTSAIVGETAYECEPGFIGELAGAGSHALSDSLSRTLA
jgi:hypothetical protein